MAAEENDCACARREGVGYVTDYVDEMLRSAAVSGIQTVNGIHSVGEAEIAQAGAEAAVRAHRARRPGAAPPTLPFGRSDRELLRRAPLGFPDATVGANASVNVVSQQVSRVFHPDRLLAVPSAPGIVVDSIRIGDEEQTVTAGAPIELYGVQALTDSLPDNFSPVQTGTTVTIALRNTTGAAIDVTMGMKGGVQR